MKNSEILSIKLCYDINHKINSFMRDLIIKEYPDRIECYIHAGNISLEYFKETDSLYIYSFTFLKILPTRNAISEYYSHPFKNVNYYTFLFKEYFNIP